MNVPKEIILDRYSAFDYAALILESEKKIKENSVSATIREQLLWNYIIYDKINYVRNVDTFTTYAVKDPLLDKIIYFLFSIDFIGTEEEEIRQKYNLFENSSILFSKTLNNPGNSENSTCCKNSFFADSPEVLSHYYYQIYADLIYKGVISKENEFNNLLNSHKELWKFYLDNQDYYNNDNIYKQIPTEDKKLLDLADSYINVSSYTELSNKLNIPAYSKLASFRQSQEFHFYPKKTTIPSEIVLQIYFEESLFRPILKNFSDAAKLKNDSRIHDFKEIFFKWIEIISTGNESEEIKIRKEIKKANKALKSLNSLSSISGVVSIISLPIGVAEMLLAGGFVGLSVTALGAALTIVDDQLKKKYRWLTIGQ